MSGPLGRWKTFLRERYEPVSHLFMSGGFALGNAAVAVGVVGARPPARHLVAAVAIAFVFFLRLRIFDEVKDHDTDASVNPDRPLARGLIEVAEARRVAVALAVIELGIVVAVEPAALAAWLVAFFYSLAMFAEFWIGEWLRPRLELYAVSHTLVVAGLGVCLAGLVTGLAPWELPAPVWLLAPANWGVFNIFEFSRKTFAPSEERAGVPSYSNRLGSWGAAALTLACVAVALICAWAVLSAALPGPTWWGVVLLGSAALVLGAVYASAPRAGSARAFRTGMLAWAIGYYASLAATPLVWS